MDQLPSFKSFSYLCFFCFTICLGWINVGYIYTVFDASGQQIILSLGWKTEDLNFFQALTSGSLPVGSLIAVIISGLFFSKKSRRKQLIFADLCIIAGALLTLDKTFQFFIAGRLLQGTAIGLNMLICPIYVREISPPDISGRLGSILRLCYCLGSVLVFLLAFGLPALPNFNNQFWKFMFVFPVLVSVLRIILFLVIFKYDSPKFYLLNKQVDKASEIVAEIYHEHVHEGIIKSLWHERIREKKLTLGRLFRRYSQQLKVCFLMAFLLEWTGNNAVTTYASSILASGAFLQMTPNQVYQVRAVNCLVGFVQIICALAGGYFLDQSGRKKLLLYGDAILAISVGIQGISLQIGLETLARIMVVFFVLGGSMSFILVDPIMMSELLPYKGCSLMYTWANIQIAVISCFFPIILQTYRYGLVGSMYLFSFIALLGLWAIKKCVLETKGMTMDEIYKEYEAKSLSNEDKSIMIDGDDSIDIYSDFLEDN